MHFSLGQIQSLPALISAPRFATYLAATANDPRHALALYTWNLEISAAALVLLQICEVSTRNAVSEALEQVHGNRWPWSPGFVRSLPVPKRARDYNPQINLSSVARNHTTTGKVVADLNFAFWEKVFTVGQDQRLWLPHFQATFPHFPPGISVPVARARFYNEIQNVRKFRNRIAHHEPIFARNLRLDYDRILDLIQWRSPDASDWVRKIEKFNLLLGQRP